MEKVIDEIRRHETFTVAYDNIPILELETITAVTSSLSYSCWKQISPLTQYKEAIPMALNFIINSHERMRYAEFFSVLDQEWDDLLKLLNFREIP